MNLEEKYLKSCDNPDFKLLFMHNKYSVCSLGDRVRQTCCRVGRAA